ncbi:hypothetical protein NDU88_001537 [Pleurodeles waltl]|uniref:Uncharacterized protein n=1 Tax=Pleurodeles waltl TaxID=8319 RepID=A0AAV7UVL6_PLEWA|nr:hypothetical protein NDU88_001537 [Pleurodeles waltl]
MCELAASRISWRLRCQETNEPIRRVSSVFVAEQQSSKVLTRDRTREQRLKKACAMTQHARKTHRVNQPPKPPEIEKTGLQDRRGNGGG